MSDKIFIKEISMKNWAQFADCKIEFPTTDDTPIIYFIAENGVGKTRIFQAIRVALFGAADFSIYGKSNLVNFIPLPIKNEIWKAIRNEEPYDENVNISLIINLKVIESTVSCFYKIERNWTFGNFQIKEDEVKGDIIDDGDEAVVYRRTTPTEDWEEYFEDINPKLSKWFPLETREFYFFDGENLDDIMIGKREVRKTDIINKLLRRTDCYPLKEIIKEVESQKSKFQKFAESAAQKKKNVREGLENFKKAQNDLKANEDQILEISKKLEGLEENNTQIQIKIDNIGINEKDFEMRNEEKKKIKKYSKLEDEQKEIYTKLGEKMKENNMFEWILIQDILEEVYQDLFEKKTLEIIPTKLDKEVYDILIRRGFCICGEGVDENKKKKILEEKEKVVDPRLNDESTRFLSELGKIKNSINEIMEELKEKKRKFKKIQEKIEILGEISDEDTKQKENFQAYVRLSQNKETNITKIARLKDNKKRLEKNTPSIKKKVENAESTYERRLRAEGKVEDSELYHIVSYDILKKLKDIESMLENDIIRFIKEQAESDFFLLMPNSEYFSGIYISENWKFGFYLSEAPNVPVFKETGPSKGQFHVLGISFLHSLSKVAESKLPLLFDTPFGRISKRPKVLIGRNLPKLFRGTQVILFLTEEEANNMLTYITGKIGYLILNPSRLKASIESLDDDTLKEFIHKKMEEIQEESA